MMKASTRVSASATSTMKTGTLLGIGAYSLWGLFPLYWKQLASVPAVQVLAHRIMWSFLCTSIALLFFPKARSELAALFRSPKRLFAIAAAGVLISVNWGIYIWAINASRIVESSMGYYLNPLVSVLLGALIFKEKIDRGMILAGFIALCGIMILIVSYGRLPWVALSLAFSFALYGAIKKLAGLSGLAGLAAETSVVAPFALAYTLVLGAHGSGACVSAGPVISILLALGGPVTAIPLLLYAEGVNRIPLSRMGFLQYLSPSYQLLLGLFVYGEKLAGVQLVAFAFILCALAVFALTRASPSTRAR